MSGFFHSFKNGIKFAGAYGAVGAAVFAGVTAIFGGPVLVVGAVGAGLLGLFGTAMSAVNDGTSGEGGDYRGTWTSGLPTTALMVAGMLALGGDKPAPAPVKDLTTVTQQFNGSVSKKVSTAEAVGCVPKGSYPVSTVASKGPLAPGG